MNDLPSSESFPLPSPPSSDSPMDPGNRIKNAVLAERERCAKIAEFFESNADEFRSDNPGWSGFTEACELIADKIRSGE